MARLKNAPYVKLQNKNPFDECYIIAGSDAFNNERKEQIKLFTKSEHNDQPVILNTERLAELNYLRIAPEFKKAVSIFKAGELTETQRNAICLNLAKHTEADTVAFVDEAMQSENVSDYIKRIREGLQTGESTAAEITAKAQPQAPLPDLSQEKPTFPELVELFLRWHDQPLRQDTLNGVIYQYNGTYWQAVSSDEFKRKVLAFFKKLNSKDYTITKINKLAELTALEMPSLPVKNSALIGFENGVLNKNTGVFIPHREDHFLRTVEPFPLNTANTDIPHFIDWLDFVSEGSIEKHNAILAGLYMVLTNRYEWGLFLDVTGKGGAGKSVFGQIATIINGRANTSVIDIQGFEDPKILSGLLGKTLAYSPDQKHYTGSADGLKAVTGGDTIKAKFLFNDYFDFEPTIVFMMSTNYPITFTDRNGGIARRRVIIPFNKKIPNEKKDVHFIDKIKNEIYGITNFLLQAFPEPETARKILERYQESGAGDAIKQESNHLIDFAKAFTLIDSCAKGLEWGSHYGNSRSTKDGALYKAYLHYCDCIGLRQYLNTAKFKQEFPEALKELGENGELFQKKIQGTIRTNVQWRDKEQTLSEWES